MVNKFLNLEGLSNFLDKLKEIFASKDIASTSSNGLMSYQDKINLDNLVENWEQYDIDGGNSQTPDEDYDDDQDGGGA